MTTGSFVRGLASIGVFANILVFFVAVLGEDTELQMLSFANIVLLLFAWIRD